MGFRGGREIDEDRDEDQHRVEEQPDEAERESDALADERSDFGRAHAAHARISLGRAWPLGAARNASSARTPSRGKAGIMLNTARNRFTAASRSIIEVCGLSTA